jgi:DUF1009 family protein
MPDKLGIIAGSGELPVKLIDACRNMGRDVFVVALEGHAAPQATVGVAHAWARIGAVGRIIALLREAGVAELVMAGKVERPSLAELRPDWRTLKFLAGRGGRLGSDDDLLAAIVETIEREEGIRVVGPGTLLADLPAPPGALGRHRPGAEDEADIALGVLAARQLGALDIGQAVVVQQGLVLAVEAAEGTDRLIIRAGELRRSGRGPVLVKIRKPQQDGRADPPVIGPETARQVVAAGFAGIAVEAGGTLILDRPEVTRIADDAGLFVVGIDLVAAP